MERCGARRLSREFKLAALARMAGENVSVLSRELKVQRKLLYQWRLAVEVGVLGLVDAARDDGRDPLATECGEQPGGRVRLVGDDGRGLPARPAAPAGAQASLPERRTGADQVVTPAAGKVGRHGPAMRVATEMDFRREAAA